MTTAEDSLLLDDLFCNTNFVESEVCVSNDIANINWSIRTRVLDSTMTDYDLTGHMIWPAAKLLCKFIASTYGRSLFSNKKTIELGSGVGVCGILMAKVAESVVLTDHNNAVIDLLQYNIQLNESVAKNCSAKKLEWKSETDRQQLEQHGYDIVFGSDIIYYPAVLEGLVQSVDYLLSMKSDARFVLAFKSRFLSTEQLFFELMDKYGFLVEEVSSPQRNAVDPIIATWNFQSLEREMASTNMLVTQCSNGNQAHPSSSTDSNVWGDDCKLIIARRKQHL